MDIYSGKIRLAGDMRNEVRRAGMTAPEVILLQRIHGPDAVLELEKMGSEKRNHQEERQRLYLDYPAAINTDAKRHYVEELFGPNHNDLPTSVPGVAISPKRGKDTVNVSELMG
jgi:hypothetical protein